MKVVKVVILSSFLTGGLKGLYAVKPGENGRESLGEMWKSATAKVLMYF